MNFLLTNVTSFIERFDILVENMFLSGMVMEVVTEHISFQELHKF
jgi:hypothetical protein